jgi:peptidoglycan/LPS O-acetylase OafA/YrhL
MAPYLIGTIFGIIYNKAQANRKMDDFITDDQYVSRPLAVRVTKKLQSSPGYRLCFYVTGLLIILVIPFLPITIQNHGFDYWSMTEHALYLSCSRSVYVIGIGLLVTPVVLGGGQGILYSLLANKLMVFLGKLTFGVYLFHIIVLEYKAATVGYTPSLGHREAVFESLNVGLISFLLSFFDLRDRGASCHLF